MGGGEETVTLTATLHIRRNADGLICSSPTDFDGDFIWSEGNFACDCNRMIFFCQMIGEDDNARKCGDEAFSVRITAADDGRSLYEDDDWNMKP